MSRRLSEFVGVVLFAAGLIWLISLVSHEPTDPVWFFTTGATHAPANFVGRVGAFLSELSFQLFGYAAYLFIDPHGGPSIEQKIGVARTFVEQDRPDAALAQLKRILETEKLNPPHKSSVHLLAAEAWEQWRKQRRDNVPLMFQRVIENTHVAVEHVRRRGLRRSS